MFTFLVGNLGDVMRFFYVVTTCLAVGFILACSEPSVVGGRIVVRNDVLDKQYNSFQVDLVRTSSGLQSYRKDLTPGDEVALPYKNIKSFRVTRRYADHTNIYHVSCPSNFDVEVQMKLIDIHTNRLQAGCVLSKKGQRSRSGIVRWED